MTFLIRRDDKLPMRSDYLVWTQLVEVTGIHPSRLGELIELGWIEAVVTPENEYLFHRRDALRLRRLERLCRDFEINCVGGSIIVDLLERIDSLEKRLKATQRTCR